MINLEELPLGAILNDMMSSGLPSYLLSEFDLDSKRHYPMFKYNFPKMGYVNGMELMLCPFNIMFLNPLIMTHRYMAWDLGEAEREQYFALLSTALAIREMFRYFDDSGHPTNFDAILAMDMSYVAEHIGRTRMDAKIKVSFERFMNILNRVFRETTVTWETKPGFTVVFEALKMALKRPSGKKSLIPVMKKWAWL